ncbi:hypothetical protein HK097_007895 [Rhizophlyctis rosea]|uniref:Autophagy-related protein n=1 Tax=Rhizophlyctis rosea TaxID=64517 RepID=A0AAD5X9E7_9FUNG|nr:hypothetical protein HK097_007895 [Rhizophlyctis rosea]
MALLGLKRYQPIDESGFRQEHAFDKRQGEAKRILTSYPDRIPMYASPPPLPQSFHLPQPTLTSHTPQHSIVERSPSAKNTLPEMDKKKFLCPSEITVAQFQYVIRKRLKLAPEHALFLIVNNRMPPSSAQLTQVYQEHKDEDGFL